MRGREETFMKIRHLPAAPAAIVAALLVAGCGGGGPGPAATASAGPPPNVAALPKQVRSAMTKAASVHISAALTQGGDDVSLDMTMTRSGDMSGGMALNHAPVVVLVTRGQTYVKVTSALLKSQHLPTAACQLMCGKYLKVPASQAKSMLGGMTLTSLLNDMTSSKPHWTYVRTVTVDGQPTWQMRDTDGSMAYVAAHGPPYLLRLTKGSQHLDFTLWNAATIPPPPPASQVVDISQLEQ